MGLGAEDGKGDSEFGAESTERLPRKYVPVRRAEAELRAPFRCPRAQCGDTGKIEGSEGYMGAGGERFISTQAIISSKDKEIW